MYNDLCLTYQSMLLLMKLLLDQNWQISTVKLEVSHSKPILEYGNNLESMVWHHQPYYYNTY